MSHLDSPKLPATLLFGALLIIIMLSSSRITYTLGPAKSADTKAPAEAAMRTAGLPFVALHGSCLTQQGVDGSE